MVVSLTSSSPVVASVSGSVSIPAGIATGTVTVVGNTSGQTTITATLQGVSRTATLSVSIPPKDPTIEKPPVDKIIVEKALPIEQPPLKGPDRAKGKESESLLRADGGGGTTETRLALNGGSNDSEPHVATRRAFISLDERVSLDQALRSQLDQEDVV